MRRRVVHGRQVLVAVCLSVGLSSSVAAPQAVGASLALVGNSSFAQSSAGLGSDGTVFETILESPLTSSSISPGHLLARKHPSSADSAYDLGSQTFDLSFTLIRAGSMGSYAAGSIDLFFTTTSDSAFDLAGSMTTVDADGRSTLFEVSLIDRTTGSILFSSIQRSLSTPNESFLLGAGGGDQDDVRVGSPFGLLRSGRLYELFVGSEIRADLATPALATATGSFSLVLVPEPGSAVLLALGLFHLARRRDRRQGRV